MKNVLGVTSADNGQVEKNGTTEEHKSRNELQCGGTPNTPVSNLASS